MFQLFFTDECPTYYTDDDEIISLGQDEGEIKDFLLQMDINLYNKQDIDEAESRFNDFGLPQTPSQKCTIATQTDERIYITTVPKHIFSYITKNCVPLPRTPEYNPGKTNRDTMDERPDSADSNKENKDPGYDSGYEDNEKELGTDVLNIILDLEDDLQLSRPTDADEGDDKQHTERSSDHGPISKESRKEPNSKADDWEDSNDNILQRDYVQRVSTKRDDRKRFHQNEVSIREANSHKQCKYPETAINHTGFSKEQRVRYRSKRKDLVDVPDTDYQHCKQCGTRPTERISLGAHKRSLVRCRLVIHDIYPSKTMDIDAFYVWNNIQDRPDKDIQKDYDTYGRQTYWQDPEFYRDIVQESQFRIVKRFPVKPLLDLKANVNMTPICITYPTIEDDIYVIPMEALEGKWLIHASEPKHQPVSEHDTEVDAEYMVTFRFSYDIQPSKDLQLKASEDELVQRLKDITIDKPHTSLTNMAKLILAYAAFQERQHDKDFENNWRVHSKATPIEELLDLRTQLDMKHKKTKEDLYTRVYSKGFDKGCGEYPTYTHLPGLKRRYERNRERRLYGVPKPNRARSPPRYAPIYRSPLIPRDENPGYPRYQPGNYNNTVKKPWDKIKTNPFEKYDPYRAALTRQSRATTDNNNNSNKPKKKATKKRRNTPRPNEKDDDDNQDPRGPDDRKRKHE